MLRLCKTIWLCVVLCLSIPFLAGCLTNEYQATIGANDTISGSFTSRLPVEAVRQSESPSGKTPDELETEGRAFVAQIVEDLSSELGSITENNPPAVIIAKNISNSESLGLEVLFENLPFATDENGDFESLMTMFGLELRISREENNQVLKGTIGQDKPESFDEFTKPGMLPVLGLLQEGLDPTISLSVTFAGPIEKTNGEVQEGNVRWERALFDMGQIQATANVPFQREAAPRTNGAQGANDGVSPMLIVTGGLIAAAIVGGVYVFITGRRNEEHPDDYDDDDYDDGDYDDDDYDDGDYDDDDYDDDDYDDDDYDDDDYDDDDYDDDDYDDDDYDDDDYDDDDYDDNNQRP